MSLTTIPQVDYRERALKSLDLLPPFSPVFNHLMASLAKEDVSLAELSTVIERDTVLSGNVLRLVNSVLYGRRGTISSVRHALSIIGLSKLRNYVLGLSATQLWRKVQTAPSWSMPRFNHHSAAVAVWSDLLVQKLPVENAEGAFAAGLLHDIGKLMIAVSLPAEYEQIQKLGLTTGRPAELCEQETIGVSHSSLGAAALSRWNLPVPIQRAIATHHQSPPTSIQLTDLTLSRIIQLADLIADHQGYSLLPIESEKAPATLETLNQLGLGRHAQQMIADFETDVTSLLSAL